jgi:non-ribosomal peptide synthase protein (TIGR01720 family)
LYGPTENTVWTTWTEVKTTGEWDKQPTIGGPIGNHRVYILGPHFNLKPIGAVGELCVGGEGLARGYLNRQELTKEKFIDNPFVRGEKIYRTGDLARWLPDGNIEFIGRIDYQVKLRGFRIELAEIEHRLLKNEGIENAVVLAKEDKSGNKYLCAYIVLEPSYWAIFSDSAKTFDASQLKQHLAMTLPEYMIPSHFVEIEEIPVTPNGKIDRKVLPEPESGGTMEYAAPTNDIEETMVKIWQEVLKVEKVGIHDNFFHLGGDSIKSIQVSSRMQKHRLELKVKDLFSTPTIRELGKLVKTIDSEIPQGTVSGNVPLTPVHLWFLENNSIYMRPFNQSMMLYKREGFDEAILEKVFTRLVEHHDALRMVYEKEGDKYLQRIKGIKKEGKLFDKEIVNLEDSEEKNIAVEIQREGSRIQQSNDPTKGPLVKLGLFKTIHGHHLLIAIHHFVMDGVSWRILFEDLSLGFQQAEKGEEIVFQQKTHSFKYWADKLQEYAQSHEALKEIEYWKKVEETNLEPLPVDHRIGKEMKEIGNTAAAVVDLNEEHTGMLLKEVNQAYNTEINDILLTALGLAIKEWVGLEKVAVNQEGHGREEIIEHVNVSRTIGWFAASYPVVLDMTNSRDLAYMIKFVKETLRKVPNKGIGYGILKYLTPPGKRKGLEFGIKPAIGFNYLGQFGQENSNDNDSSHHDGSSIYEFSPMNGGVNISPAFKQNCPIEISGILVNQKLCFTFFYKKYEYEKESTKKLADFYKSNLIKIIRHCSRKEGSELTPSDLVADDTELSLEVLDEIKEFTDLYIE